MKPIERAHLQAVRDPETGEVILYDIFLDQLWHGSRRTVDQCAAYIMSLRGAQATVSDP